MAIFLALNFTPKSLIALSAEAGMWCVVLLDGGEERMKGSWEKEMTFAKSWGRWSVISMRVEDETEGEGEGENFLGRAGK